MAGPSLTKVQEAEERLAAFKREVKEMQQRDRHASTSPPHARILGDVGDATAEARAGPSSSSRPLLPPLRAHPTSFASPRELQAVAKQREAVVYAEYQLEREKIEREIQSAYQLQLQKLHLQAKTTMVEQLDRRQREREMRAREHFELARRGIKREDVTVVTTSSVPGHKVKEVCGTVTGSYMMREISEDAMPDEARITLSLARDEAYADLISEAQKLLANAVVSFRWQSRTIGYETTEMLATGTALRIEHDGPHACHECGSVKKGGKGGDNSGKGKGGKGGNDGGNAKGKGKQKNHNDNSDEDEDEDDEWAKEEKKNQKGGKGGGGDNNGGGKGGGKGGKGGNNLSTSQQLVKLLLEAKIKEDKRTQTQMVRDQIFGMLDGFFQGQNPSFNPYSSGTLEWLNQAEQQQRARAGPNNGGGNKGNDGGWGNDADKGKKGGNLGDGAKKADAGWGDAASGEEAQPSANPAAQKQAGKQKGKQAAAVQSQVQTKDQPQQPQQQGKKGKEKQAAPAREKDRDKTVSWGAYKQAGSAGTGSKTASKAPTPQSSRGVSVGPASPAPAAWGAADAGTSGWGASPGPGPGTEASRGGGQAQREPSPAWGGQNAAASNDDGWV